eukprot:6368891-Pyramimonas_sp.AAC.1
MSNYGAAMMMPSTVVGAEVGETGTLALSVPLGWCDVLTKTARPIAHVPKHGTSPRRSLAIMPDAKLRPASVGLRWV